ncbi:hypothetical protein BpHYR1_007109 [Brachionus plicatilis]|uniref:Uncharacterized protein n=1 Tax=Brachionus plicatilis TaxID=10195 RepID=A0A3M7SIT7_BRAPC|nr:hypothetical protein BpHYR1_007109 [Brachionus plicatilis]
MNYSVTSLKHLVLYYSPHFPTILNTLLLAYHQNQLLNTRYTTNQSNSLTAATNVVQAECVNNKLKNNNYFISFEITRNGKAQYLLLVILAQRFPQNIYFVTESFLGLLDAFSCIESSLTAPICVWHKNKHLPLNKASLSRYLNVLINVSLAENAYGQTELNFRF